MIVTMKSQNNPNVVVPLTAWISWACAFGDSDNRYGFVTKIIHMAALSLVDKMQYIAHRGYSLKI
jgi:hypothetical protein